MCKKMRHSEKWDFAEDGHDMLLSPRVICKRLLTACPCLHMTCRSSCWKATHSHFVDDR